MLLDYCLLSMLLVLAHLLRYNVRLLTATLDGLGAVGDGAHAIHEMVQISPMVERSALLALLLLAPTEYAAEPSRDKAEPC
jgi:hypothetical protein